MFADALAAARAHLAAGRLREAEAASRELLADRPDCADALGVLGLVAAQAGRIPEAIALLRRASAAPNAPPEAHYNLGLALQQAEQLDAAEEAYRAAIRLAPAFALPHINLGNILQLQGRTADAIAAYRQALAIDPRVYEANRNLGLAFARIGAADDAITAFTAAAEIAPGAPSAWNELGNAFTEAEQFENAETAYRRAIAVAPDFAMAHRNLAFALALRNRIGESEAACREAIRLDPTCAPAWQGLGNALDFQGDPRAACTAWEQALRLDSKLTEAEQNILFSMNYRDDVSADDVRDAHAAWAARRYGATPSIVRSYGNNRDPDRRLRVGLVSGDFRNHSVAMFLLPWLASRDRANLELICYSNVSRGDNMTFQLRGFADGWCDIRRESDDAVARKIVADGIDVLIDLGGHTRGNRLGIFARRPAPVAATWLGYPNTTGMKAVGWRITDPIADPPGTADELAIERLVRIDDGFLCFATATVSPPVALPPVEAAGQVTFGSFNNPAKMSPSTVAAWARILAGVEGARLTLKAWAVADPAVRAVILERFGRHGTDPARIKFMAGVKIHHEHLAQYHQIDVALDPFPYNGTTTTFEALWMGVPVVTLAGDRHAARVGAAILTRVGHCELIASTPDEYVTIAVRLAHDRTALGAHRQGLRDDLTSSTLCDQPRFTRNMAVAIRTMWRYWCEQSPGRD